MLARSLILIPGDFSRTSRLLIFLSLIREGGGYIMISVQTIKKIRPSKYATMAGKTEEGLTWTRTWICAELTRVVSNNLGVR